MTANTSTIDFADLRIVVARDGNRVTGKVSAGEVSVCRIDYRSRQGPGSSKEPPHREVADRRARLRFEYVQKWRQLCQAEPGVSATAHAKRVASECGCSPSSLRGWAHKLDCEGVDGLHDRYVPAPKKCPTWQPAQAKEALLLCAWWAYRIGNVEMIDTRMMSSAIAVVAAGYPIADLLAAVDFYFGWDCDRAKYPFKPFRRWIKYDLETWLHRAAESADYRRAMRSDGRAASARQRKRLSNCKQTQRAIKDLAESYGCPIPSGDGGRAAANPLDAARWAKRFFHHDHTAHRLAAKALEAGCPIPSGGGGGWPTFFEGGGSMIQPLISNKAPSSLAESLATLPDAYRVMLIDAARGDRGCIAEASATLPMWWDHLPQAVRNNIDAKVTAWQADHPKVTDQAARKRRLQLLFPQLRDHRAGTQRLSVAARLPA